MTAIRRPAPLPGAPAVSSTEELSHRGNQRWRAVLDRHDALVGRQLQRYRGHLVKLTGDGLLASFDGPGSSRAMRRRDTRDGPQPWPTDPSRTARRRGNSSRRRRQRASRPHRRASLLVGARRRDPRHPHDRRLDLGLGPPVRSSRGPHPQRGARRMAAVPRPTLTPGSSRPRNRTGSGTRRVAACTRRVTPP
jgi:hypothetical protein